MMDVIGKHAEALDVTSLEVDERLFKISDLCKRLSLGRTTIYRLIKQGAFPAPVQLGPAAVRWKSSEIDAWISSRPPTRSN